MKNRLAILLLAALAPVAIFAQDATIGPPDFAQLASFVQARAATDSFSGVVLITRGDSTIWSRAVGYANVARRLPNTLDTRFDIASVGKMFTGVAIMQLLQTGRVRLDVPVGTYLPDFPNASVRDSVTIAQLLTHTSGLGSYFSPDYFQRHDQLRRLSDFVPLFASRPLQFPIGTRFLYSNAGYIVLGLIVERVTGEPFSRYVGEHILAPAGMRATGFCRDEPSSAPLATGYTTQTPTGPVTARQPNDPAIAACGGSAGGGYSTATDLARFAAALMASRLIDAAHTELATTGKVDMPTPGLRYGYGFGIQGAGRDRSVGHNGGFIGANAEIRTFPELGYTVVVLSNYDPPSAEAIAERATQLIRAVTE